MDAKQIAALLETEQAAIQNQRLLIAESYKEYIDTAGAIVEKLDGRQLTENDRANIGQCLENAKQYVLAMKQTGKWGMLSEATQANYINFLGINRKLCAA